MVLTVTSMEVAVQNNIVKAVIAGSLFSTNNLYLS